MSRHAIHICSFASGIDDLTRKQQRDHITVLRALQANPMFSTFSATANQGIARTMTTLSEQGYVTYDNSPGYPWTKAILTDKGRALLHTKGHKP